MKTFHVTEDIVVTHNSVKYRLDKKPLAQRSYCSAFVGRKLNWLGRPSGDGLILVVFENNVPSRVLATFVNTQDALNGFTKYVASNK